MPMSSDLPRSTTVTAFRPDVAQLVNDSLLIPSDEVESGLVTDGSGLAVIACGPEGLVGKTRNAVATLGVGERVRSGGVAFHGECYAL